MIRLVLALLALLPPAICAAPPPASKVAGEGGYTWQPWRDTGDYLLLRNGSRVGIWDAQMRVYRPVVVGGTIGPPCDPPVTLPTEISRAPLPVRILPGGKVGPPPVAEPNFGVDYDKIAEGYSINGRRCTRGQAIEAIAKNLPDDAGKLRLTIIGPEADRKAVVADLASNPSLLGLAPRLLVQAYDPDARMLAGLGFVTDGKPTIYLQTADGKVLHRQDDYALGPEKLAEAIRKADGSYRPKDDPNLSNPLGLPFKVTPPILAAGAVVAFLLLRKKD